ncbi:hypothetical protein NP493_506g02043 [Ridgeia piscesae]|uniref:Uncharacterized protein n=1 Tax=Ridgeia piscesae TaxID=27915 RepID=A0AAD9KXM2_RIDPI|nr:hypothetical protein NP493_506g02043 [Ridgeia piscesae]
MITLCSCRIAILSVVVVMVRYDETVACSRDLREHALGYLVILSGCVIIEGCIVFVSMRGTILVTRPRASMQYLLYIRLREYSLVFCSDALLGFAIACFDGATLWVKLY